MSGIRQTGMRMTTMLVGSNEETQTEVEISDSDSSGRSICSMQIGAASRVAV
jgi:hypothetical protein